MIEFFQTIIDTFGAIIVFPIMLIVIELVLKVPAKKAIISGLSAGAGLQGFYLLVGAYTAIIDPIINNMVTSTGVNLPALDVGWQATAAVAYATNVGMMFMPIAILLGFFLFFIKFTDIFQPSDLWNNYIFMIFGSMCYLLTESFMLSMGMMIFMFCLHLTFGELLEKRWSTYYNFPGCTQCAGFLAPNAPIFVFINWLENKLGMYKVKADPSFLKKKLSILGDPIVLGFVIGLIIGLVGYFKELSTLSAWGTACTCAVSTAALMAIFPKIGSIFASAFIPLTQASKATLKNRTGDFYINLNDACSYGETANLISSLISIPLVLAIAFIMPGNIVLPLVSLPSIPYESHYSTALSNGNIFKTVVAILIFAILRLLVASSCAAMFTEVAVMTGFALTTGVAMISSMGTDLGNPVLYLVFLAFVSKNPIIIGLTVVAYVAYFIWFKKNKVKVQAWIERQAMDPAGKGPEPANTEAA